MPPRYVTTTPKGVDTVRYMMRHMRLDYLDALRVLAVLERTTLEQQLLRAIGKGLPILKAEYRAKRGA